MSLEQSVFILGTAYSGSTLLGRALNSHSQVGYIGELSRAKGYFKKYHLDKEAGECLDCIIAGNKCEIFNRSLIKSTNALESIDVHKALSEKIDKPIIVDGSKHVEWLRIATQKNVVQKNIKVIILARSPVAYIRSCKDRQIGPIWVEANAWRDTYYDALRTVAQLNLPHIIVQFEEFLDKPKQTMQQICRLLGINFETSMLANEPTALHAIGGNPSAYKISASKSTLVKMHKKLGQVKFDVNPQNLYKNKAKPIKPDKEATGAVFMTPDLINVANLIGYRRSHLFPDK